MRLKFSDFGAERLRRAALGAEAGVGSLRAREEEVVEKRRGVVMVVVLVEGVVRERRERRLKSPVMEEDAILERVLSCRCLFIVCISRGREEIGIRRISTLVLIIFVG